MDAHAIDQLWDYDDPTQSEERFRAQLEELSEKDQTTRLQLLSQIARTYSLRHRFQDAHHLLDEVETQMESGSLVEVRYLLERGRTFNSDKQPEKSVPLFERAADLARRIGAEFYYIDALHMLGIAAPEANRLGWHETAIKVTQESKDERARGWLGSLSNNLGWTYFDQQDYEKALTMFQQAEQSWGAQGKDDLVHIARWSQAKTLRVMGRVEEGLSILRALEEKGLTGFTAEEIGECLLALAQADEAKPYFQIAHHELSQIDWVAEDTARIERLKQHSE